MPCYDDRNSPSYIEADYEKKVRKLTARLDQYARMMCEILTNLDGPSGIGLHMYSKEVQEWWAKHQEFDRKRKKK